MLVSVGAWSRPYPWDVGCYLCLRVVCAWICRREVAGQALKGTGRVIMSRLVLLSCTRVIWFRARLVQTLPPCVALSPELTWDEVDSCVFPSWLPTAGWDQPSPVVCPFQFACLGFAAGRVSQWPEGTLFPL